MLVACAAQPTRPVTSAAVPSLRVSARSPDLDAAVGSVDAALAAEGDGGLATLTEARPERVAPGLRALTAGRSCRGDDGPLHGLDAPRSADYLGCAAEGTPGRDAPLNVLKNCADEPPADAWECRDVAWMLALPVPDGLPREMRRSQTRVRVCGWTMLDPEHPSEVGGSRSTLWEVHPILHIDVQRAEGDWQEL